MARDLTPPGHVAPSGVDRPTTRPAQPPAHPPAQGGRVLVVSDVDSTLIRQEVIELLAAHAGRQAEVAAVTERAMRGEIDFAESLRERVSTLAGLPVTVLDEVRSAVRLSEGAQELVESVLRAGHIMALVSGGFAEIVEPLAASLGIDHVTANRLEVEGSGEQAHLTGQVAGPIVDRAMKASTLRALAAAHGIPPERTVAIGDGANDLEMMAAAGLSIAYHAKPAVAAAAQVRLDGRLDDALEVIGIPRATT